MSPKKLKEMTEDGRFSTCDALEGGKDHERASEGVHPDQGIEHRHSQVLATLCGILEGHHAAEARIAWSDHYKQGVQIGRRCHARKVFVQECRKMLHELAGDHSSAQQIVHGPSHSGAVR